VTIFCDQNTLLNAAQNSNSHMDKTAYFIDYNWLQLVSTAATFSDSWFKTGSSLSL